MQDPDTLIRLTTYYMAGAFMMFIMMVILHRFHRRDYLVTWALSWAVLLMGYLMLYYGVQFDAVGFIWVYGLFILTGAFLQQRGVFMFAASSYPRSRLYACMVMVGLYLAMSVFGHVLEWGIFSTFFLTGVLYLDAGGVLIKTRHRPFVIYGMILGVYALVIASYPLFIRVPSYQGILDTLFILFGMAVAYGMVAMHLIDVFEKEQALQERLYYLSFHDHMTGLRNRAYLESFLDTLNASEEVNAAIMMADLDTLKVINDQYGHAAGDVMIIQAGKILKESLRASDLLVRYGGDEFVGVFANRDEAAMKAIERQTQKRAQNEVVEDIQLSISIGYAIHRKGRSIYATLREAEKRMYEHKRIKQQEQNTQ